MVRIANSITELMFGGLHNFKEVCRHPVELVRAIKIAMDNVGRVTIANF